jgi:hypothetical protein
VKPVIRKAGLGDVDAIFFALQRAKQRTVYCTTRVVRERAVKTIRQCISGPQAYARVATDEDGISGVLLGIKEQIWFSDLLEAKDIVFCSQTAAAARDLVQDFSDWAWSDSRVAAVLLAQSSGRDVGRTTKWFEAMGFETVGAVHRLGRWDVPNQRAAI